LEIGNLNVLGNGYLEDPKRWQVVASWVWPVSMKYKHTIAMSHLFNHGGLGWQIMSFPWPHYMTWSSSDDHTLIIVTKMSLLNMNFSLNPSNLPPQDLNVMEWPCSAHYVGVLLSLTLLGLPGVLPNRIGSAWTFHSTLRCVVIPS
jgi:hypothetical protein